MKETYNEIINNMKAAYFEECGLEPSPASDLELRFKAVASEIFSAYSFAEYVLKQCFPQTASGEYLDRHAQLRGVERKTASVAQGELLFSLAEPLESDVTIPAETLCASAEKPFIQFATTEAAVIPAGETSVLVAAQAISGGAEFNCHAGEITVMVNPPEYISAVTNPSEIIGGFDDENDASFRERIISSYSSRRLAVNQQSLREMVLENEKILDARVYNDDNNTLKVCVKLKGGVTTNDVVNSIRSNMGVVSISSITFDVIEAQPFEFNIRASIKAESGYDKEELCAAARDMLSEAVSSMHIGQNVSSSELEAMLYGIEGISLAEVCTVDENSMPFSCPSNAYLVLNSLSVDAYE